MAGFEEAEDGGAKEEEVVGVVEGAVAGRPESPVDEEGGGGGGTVVVEVVGVVGVPSPLFALPQNLPMRRIMMSLTWNETEKRDYMVK